MRYAIKKDKPEGYRKFYFPSGEMGIELIHEEKKDPLDSFYVRVYAELSDADSIIELLLLTNALRNYHWDVEKFYLEIPYIPFGRQDRYTTIDNPFSLKVFAQLLNELKYDIVETYDPHSLVTQALINNLTVRDCNEYFYDSIIEMYGSIDDVVLIAPDAGAEKRVYDFAKEYGLDYISCSKRRDPKTGYITGYNVPASIPIGRKLIVLDDICDGGATFIELAKNLPAHKSLSLFVTHGIFSKGRHVLQDAGYNNIYAAFNFLEKKQ